MKAYTNIIRFNNINSRIVQKMQILRTLFLTFFKVGLFTFGGGYAMLPLLKDEIVDKHGWVSDKELMDYFSIGQSTPGIIAINVSTFVGYKLRGIIGAVTATAAMVLPSLIIITLVATILKQYMHNEYLGYAFAGIRIGVTALILNTVLGMWKNAVEDRIGIAIFAAAMGLLIIFNVSAVLIVFLAAVSGFSICKWVKK